MRLVRRLSWFFPGSTLALVAALLLPSCSSSSSDGTTLTTDGKLQDEAEEDGRVVPPADTRVPDDVTDTTQPPVDVVQPADAPDVPVLKDVSETAPEDVETPEDLGPPKDTHQGPPEWLPKKLNMVWSNMDEMDMVTVRKKIVIEFEPGSRMPENAEEQIWYDAKFEVIVTGWDIKNGSPLAEVPMKKLWRHEIPGRFRRPALVLWPERCDEALGTCTELAWSEQYVPSQAYRVTAWFGGDIYDKIFHTIPAWSPGYKLYDFIVEPEVCERCFPYPVHVNVFVPPEYNSPDPTLNNTTLPWTNDQQRYAVLVGLHTYNADGLTLADTFGWGTLPRFSSQGVLEPILLVLPDATVPEPYCQGGWSFPVTSGKTCYTQFMGIPNPELVPDYNAYTNYAYFMAHTMRKAVAKRFRIRGMDDDGNKLDDLGNPITDDDGDASAPRDFYRRAWGVTGCSGGGFGTPINAFLFAKDYGAMFSLIGASPSIFNPWAYWTDAGPIKWQQICVNDNYPYEPVGDGYRDLSMMDPASLTPCPEGMLCSRPKNYCKPAADCTAGCDANPCESTGTVRSVTAFDRSIPAGSKSCFWMSPPAVSNAIVLGILCGLDTTCRADGLSPDLWRTDFEKYPFDGNIMFTTGTKDPEGPPAAFMDLDQQLDKRGVVHSFRYEDRGAVYHDWNAVHDYVEGYPVITRQDGTTVPGNFPNTGLLYPFFNNAFEGIGNHPFNDPNSSEFTTGAMDPDRDYYIDLIYPGNPALNFVEDNCPGIYNPDQEDSDGDGKGDACD
jgi:hypothetical protein